MIRRPPRSTQSRSSAASDVYKRQGLEIPADISIVSYDNIKMAPFTNPPLTTVHVPKEEIGRQLVKTLIDRINGDIHMPLQIIAPTELKIRKSAAPPRQ